MSQVGYMKLFQSLKMKERIAVQRRMEVSLNEAIMNSQYAEWLMCELIYVAARRLGRDEITHNSIEELDGNEMVALLEEMTQELGYEDLDEEDEEVPLDLKSDSSEETSETESSLTSTTPVSEQAGA
jgi:hypothetical protein